jgi:adenosylmethionine-8-amino-7-oxononanoate aminotransferase
VARRAAVELAALFEARAGHIAAVILEPLVQCAAGMAMHDPVYLREVRALCNRYDVHLIADEIAVGCGRTGTFFAFEQAAVESEPAIWPDLLCLSKGISGGYLPLSLVLSTDVIYAAFLDDDTARSFLHSHSYTGNPLACRAALAVLDRFDQEPVLQRNRDTGSLLTAALAKGLANDERIEHMRQRGMVWAFDVREPEAGVRFAERFHLAARLQGLLMRPIGRTVYLMPPYLLDEEHAAYLAERTVATLNATLKSGR